MKNTHKINKDQQGSKNSQYGTHWITNEKENKKIQKEELIPNVEIRKKIENQINMSWLSVLVNRTVIGKRCSKG
jgi:hypothetical protein